MPVLSLGRQEEQRDSDEDKIIGERNPWKEIEGTVRKVDEGKVKDCTEDVDALLVFAGLYSAVLTAFLIESYKNLAADETNSLLQQMVLQTANYRFTNGYLNSTFDPSLLPTFKAAVSDIRVNVCWFASLILSISSASFGISVKQWLREFLAMDCINPQERLRIRDARIQGLADWKLFQIAAFLPILLQISLLLFFVGLCFFTAAVHRSIGITSLFLVSCWAFLFFMSIIAPLFSPRCPYKTTLLKVPFRYARPHVRWFLGFVHRRIFALLARLRLNGPTNQRNEASVTDSKTTQGRPKLFDYYDDYLDLGMLSKLSSQVPEEDIVPEEEDKIRSADRKDLAIFSNIDDAFFDDSLLANMPRAISQRPPPLRDILRSVIMIVQGRISPSSSKTPAESTSKREPWPWTLSQRARVTLVDMLVEGMVRDLDHIDRFGWYRPETLDSEWTMSFMCLILLVPLDEAAPRSVARLFRVLLKSSRRRWNPFDAFSYQMRTLARSDPDWPARSLLFLAQSLDLIHAQESERCLRRVASRGFVDREGQGNADTYRRLLERTTDEGDDDVIAPTPQTIVALSEVARAILQNYTRDQTHADDEFPNEISLLLEFVLDASPRAKSLPNADFRKPLTGPSDGPGLRRLLAGLFTTPQTTGQLLRFFAIRTDLLSPSHSKDPLFFPHIIQEAGYPSRDDDIKILVACTEFFTSQSTSFVVDTPANLLYLCSVTWMYDTNLDEEIIANWGKLSTAIHACYEYMTQFDPDTSPCTCQYSDFDEEHTETCETAHTILVKSSLIRFDTSNKMMGLLRRFVCENRFHCARRRKHMPNKHIAAVLARAAQVATSKLLPRNIAGKLEKGVNEAVSSGSAQIDRSLAAVGPTHGNSIDGRLYAEESAGPSECSASRGLVMTCDASLGGTASLWPHSPAQYAALSSSGVHGATEGRALGSSRPSTLKSTMDTALLDYPGVSETIDGASGLNSADVECCLTCGSLTSQDDSPSSVRPADVPDSLQAVDPPRAASLEAPSADIDSGPIAAMGEHTPDLPGPHLRSPILLLNGDYAGANVTGRLNEHGEVAPSPVLRPVSPAGRQHEAAPLFDVVDMESSAEDIGDFAELSGQDPGQLVASETSELALPAVLDTYDSSGDDEFGKGSVIEPAKVVSSVGPYARPAAVTSSRLLAA